jgi:2-dehydropantoate 2-reductase
VEGEGFVAITIVGAGAIGGVVGAHLIVAGHDVTFVETRVDHVAAIRENGLIVSGEAELHVYPRVLFPHELDGDLETVFLAVKCLHTNTAMEAIAPHLTRDGYVLSLQNGLEEYKIARHVGQERTVGAFLTFGGNYLQPGEVVFTGPGSFRVGEMDGSRTNRVHDLARLLATFHPIEVTNNIFGYLWGKAAVGAFYFATALVSADVPEIIDAKQYRPMLGNIVGEVARVAQALNVRVESIDGFDPTVFCTPDSASEQIEASWNAQKAYWSGHDDQRTGVWRDLAILHRKTEVDDILDVMQRGQEHGAALPRVNALIAQIKEIETGKRQLGWHNLDELLALDQRLATLERA